MAPSEAWEDEVQEEFFLYLDTLDPDISPMSFKAFLAFKLKGWQRDREERYELQEIY